MQLSDYNSDRFSVFQTDGIFVHHSGAVSIFDLFCGFVVIRQTKPLTFADCIGDELPVGWEEAYDPVVGAYYVDHNTSEFPVWFPISHLFNLLSLSIIAFLCTLFSLKYFLLLISI